MIYRLRESSEALPDLFELDQFKLEAERARDELDVGVDNMLRQRNITPHMATSLLNDYGYAETTVWSLLGSAQALLASHDALVADAEQEIVLDKDDIKSLSGGRTDSESKSI